MTYRYTTGQTVIILILAVAGFAIAKPFPAVPKEAVDELGVTDGVPLMNGFVFVDGRYLTPPYTVTRKGNGLFINRVQIEQPVPWTYFNPDAAGEPAEPEPEAPEPDGVMFVDGGAPAPLPVTEAAPQKVASIDDLFGDDADKGMEEAKPDPAPEKAKSTTISSIDDLFGDNDGGGMEERTPDPAPEEKVKTVNSIDDLFSDDEPEEKQPPVLRRRPDVSAEREEPVVRAPADITAEGLEKRKVGLKEVLDEKRAFYGMHLARGELYFFGTSHDRVNGTYGTARALLDVLPSALRYSRSPADLLKHLRGGNVYFIDHNICEALFQNRTTFPLLQQRLEQIRHNEAMKASRNNQEDEL